MDNAKIAGEKEVEDGVDLDRIKFEKDLKDKFQKQRDELAKQLAQAKTDDVRKRLLNEQRQLDKRIEDLMNNERLHQDQVLEEKRKQRMNLKKVKEIEIEKRHMEEQAKKETEILQKKYDKIVGDQAQQFDLEVQKAIKPFEREGQIDKAILVINQSSNELMEKKLRLLINKQFFELEKYLGTLYNQLALEKMSAMQKLHARISQAE